MHSSFHAGAASLDNSRIGQDAPVGMTGEVGSAGRNLGVTVVQALAWALQLPMFASHRRGGLPRAEARVVVSCDGTAHRPARVEVAGFAPGSHHSERRSAYGCVERHARAMTNAP